ncbi:MAG: hypothetical protein JWQ38_659 [Flavipsychrobacter sp.]|nr:hypothetical protein [Flavipsychrobacter sp.]
MEDLEREQKLLKREIARLDEDDSLSLGGIGGLISGKSGKGKKDKDRDDEGGGFSIKSIVNMLPIASPITRGLMNLVIDRVIKRKDSRKEERGDVYSEDKPKKHPIRNAAVEVLGGYLKWKAVELSYKGLRHLVKKRQAKKAYEASLKYPSDK